MKSSFAQRQLEKYGWSSGKGLGKNEDGISKSISVSVKKDSLGVGAVDYEWGFKWWDHVYNKTAINITIDGSDNDKPLPSGDISNQPSVEKSRADNHGFVSESAIISNSIMDKDYSSKITDEELFRRCKGRTARKGARCNLSGKLKRVGELPFIDRKQDDSDSSSESETEIDRKNKLLSIMDDMAHISRFADGLKGVGQDESKPVALDTNNEKDTKKERKKNRREKSEKRKRVKISD